MRNRYLFLLAVCIFLSNTLFAQNKIADKIVAQVGEKIILRSEIETIYLQEASQGTTLPEDVRCYILKELITQQLLVLQAAKDSVEVTDDEVEYELDRRLRYYESLFGSREKMEEFYGKTFLEMKEEFRPDIKDILLSDRMKSQVTGEISVSPAEVKAFFNKIPKDSLPYFDAEVEYAHITIMPEPTAEQKAFARQKLEDLRQRILNGEDFNVLATIYSEDPGSKEDGGYLGCVSRGTFVSEFDAAAFKLKPGEISEIVQTQFGYHIIKLEDRQGDKICLRHILITPPITNTNYTIASKKLDSVRALIMAGNITFREAAAKYSTDESTNKSGGEVLNTQTGSTFFEIDQLEPDVYYAIEKLKPGEVSEVIPYTDYRGRKGVRLLLLNSQSPPHQANLKDDYYRLQAAAKIEKQIRLLNDWVMRKVKDVYMRVDPTFDACTEIQEMLRRSLEVGSK
ncbi:MAG: peptidylprolyl isomerase [Chitinophagales bacterium]